MIVSRFLSNSGWLRYFLLTGLLYSVNAVAGVPSVPSLSVPSSDSDGRYTVSWGSVSGASRYELVGEQSGTLYSGTSRSSSRNKGNGTYYYKVRACNSSGCSSYSSKKGITVSILTKPPTPSLSVPSSDSDGRYTVSWGSASRATRYELVGELSSTIYSGTGRSSTRTKPNGTYYYKVRACNSAGCSAYSSTKGITVNIPLPVPATPATPSASLSGGDDIRVSWNGVTYANHYYRQVSINNGAWQNRNKYTTTSVLFSNQQARSYKYRVQACNANDICSGYSATSATITVLPVPGAPSTPSVNLSGGNDITVTWNTVANADHYYRDVSLNNGSWQNRTRYNGTSASMSNQQARSYKYRVQACNAHGICGAYSATSATVTVLAVPATPGAPSASRSSADDITLSWTTVTYSDHYYRQVSVNNGSWGGTAKMNGTSVSLNNQSAASYKYRIKACNAHNICSGYSGTSNTVTVLPVPGTPNKPGVSLTGGNDISVTWNAVANANHYYREVSLNNGSWQNRTRYNGTTASMTDQQARSYKYRVQACNADNVCSAYSAASDTVTILAVPATPTAPGASKSGGNDITVSWTTVTYSNYYNRQTSINSGSWGSTTKISGISSSLSDQSAGSHKYRIQACNAHNICSAYSAASNTVTVLPIPSTPAAPSTSIANANDITATWSAVANAAHYYREVSVNGATWKNRTKYTGTSALMGNQVAGSYRYRVQACNLDNICSGYSAASTAATVLPTPVAPSIPTVSLAGGNDITVTWNAVANASHYYREVSIDSGDWQNRAQYNGTTASMSNQQARSYKYRVQACNADDVCSAYSASSAVVTVLPTPAVPVVPSVSLAGGNDITATWSVVANAAHYYTQVSVNSGSWTSRTKHTGTSASMSNQGAGDYRYRVQACNADEICSAYSGASNTITVLPVPAKPAAPSATIASGNDITASWSVIANAAHYYRQVSVNSGAWKNRTKYTATVATMGNQVVGNYSYRVQACNAHDICSDYSAASNVVTVLAIPVTPASPIATLVNGDDITIAWAAISGAAHYYREVSIDDGAWQNSTSYATNSVVYSDQQPRSYKYRVKACNADDVCSGFSAASNTVSIFAVPQTPLELSVSKSNGNDITLTWNAVTNAAHYYREVSVNGAPWKNRDKYSGITAIMANQQVGSFSYRVQACNLNEQCSVYSNPTTAIDVLAVPVAPIAPNVTVTNRNDISISWDVVANAVHYYRQVSIDEGAWQNETKFTATAANYANQQVRSYRYRVKACNADDICSEYSPASVTAVVAPQMVVEQFEWLPAEVFVGDETTFYWNVSNATSCYAQSAGANTSISRPASGQTQAYIYDEPEIHITQWYCEDAQGNRIPEDDSQFLEATRIVKAIASVSIDTVDVANLNNQNGSYQINWTGSELATSYDLVEEKDGVWGSVQNLTATSQSFSSKAAGRYRYKVRACEAAGCSRYKTSVAFNVSSFTPTPNINDGVTLTGLKNNVGFVAGQFRVSESGAATYNVPLNLPEGVAGVKPQVALNYSSQGGDTSVGRGWSIAAGDAVTRCPSNIFQNGEISAVNYDNTDQFCLGGQQLIVKSGNNGEDGSTYYSRIDNFSLITAHGSAADSGPLYFTVATKSGDTYFYGQTGDSDDTGDAFVEPNNPAGGNDKAKYWALKKVVDISGNAIRYHYNEQSDIGLHSLSRIEYGKNDDVTASRYFNQVNFNYVTNNKPQVGYSGGSAVTMNQLLDSISITVDGSSYRYYDLSYFSTKIIEERNYLESITECLSEGNDCLAPLSFTWERPDAVTSTTQEVTECEPMPNNQEFCFTYDQTTVGNYSPYDVETRLNYQSKGREYSRMFDINADGYSDIIYEDSGWRVLYGPNFNNTPQFLSNVGTNGDDRQYALTIDYDGDGKQELLVASGASSNWYVLTYNPRTVQSERCYGGRVGECDEYSYDATFETVNLGRIAIGFEGAAQVMDVDGDGLQDIVFVAGGEIKMYHNQDNGNFSTATTLSSLGDDSPAFSYNHTRHSPKMKNSAAIDINGDGRSDLITKVTTTVGSCSTGGNVESQWDCRDRGGTWSTYNTTNWKLFVSDGDMANPRLTERDILGYQGDDLRATDLNGDGLTDVVYWVANNKTWYYALSNGYELGQPHKSVYVSEEEDINQMFFIDVNGDRRADILRPVANNWSVLMSRPTNSADNIVWEFRGYVPRDKDDRILFGDANGDAKMDLLTTDNNDGWYIKYARRRNIVDNVITEFNNGWDVKTTVTYDDLLSNEVKITDAQGNQIVGEPIDDTMTLVAPMAVVKRVTSDASVNSRESVNYRYGGLLLHRKGLGSLGFKLLQTTDNQTDVTTITSYAQEYPFIGMPVRTTQIAADGSTILSESTTALAQMAVSGNGGIYPYADVTTQTQYQIGSDGTHYTLATTVTDNDFDGWGNLTGSTVTVQDGASILLTTETTNNFGSHGSFEQKMGRLQSTSVTKTPLGIDAITKSSNFSYYAENESCEGIVQTKGMLKTSTAARLTTTFCYDEFGYQHKVSKTGLLNDGDTSVTTIASSTRYSIDGRKLSEVVNNFGFTKTYSYNGLPATSSVNGIVRNSALRDANGVSVTQYFDDWGNLLATKSPVASNKYVKKAYCSSCTQSGKYYVEELQAGAPSKRIEFDKFGREIATRIQHFNDNTYSYVFKDYDVRGRLQKEYVPSFSNIRSSAKSDYTQYHYDAYGRLIRKELPNYGDSGYQDPTTTYAGLTTTVHDAKGHARSETKNLLGQVVTVTDALQGTLTYAYDAYGNIDSASKLADGISLVQVDNTYNSYGDRVTIADNDKGTWNYRHNAFGDLVWQQDAKGQQTTIQYDSVGRKSRKYSADFTQCWIYGTGGNARGKLIETRYYDGRSNVACTDANYSHTQKVDYDSAGRVFHTTEQINGVTEQLNGQYHAYSQFDGYGRLFKQRYPGIGLSITHQYKNGYSYKLVNSDTNKVYQHITNMNVYGQVKGITYANGASEVIGYDDETGLVTSHSLTKNGTLHSLAYGYDANKNLNWRSHSFGAGSGNADYHEEYGYDSLNRLNTREVILSSNDSASYNMNGSYDYDGFGNLRHKSDTGHYQYTNNRLSGIYSNDQFTGSPLYDFRYDNNGNIEFDGNRNFSYSSFNKPTFISKPGISTSFAYGVEHKRYYRQDLRLEDGVNVTTDTVYLAGVEKHLRTKAQSRELEYKVYLGNMVITERTNELDNNQTDENYLHKDHLGSPLTITNISGEVIEQNVYDPWGKVHSLYLDNQAIGDRLRPSSRGFTGHEGVDGLDIIHMNGRIYDANIGRFLQADPHIQSAKNLQNFNRYSYVLNNPLSYTDPTGYFFKALKKFVKKYWRMIAAVAVSYFTAGLASGWAASWGFAAGTIGNSIVAGAMTGFISGAVATGSLKGALMGALSGAAFGAVGHQIHGAEGTASAWSTGEQMLAHAMVGGVMGVLQGGKFGHGFLSAGIMKGVGKIQTSASLGRTLVQAIAGGTVSRLTGGKFANGAVSSAIQYTCNEIFSAISARSNQKFKETEFEKMLEAKVEVGVSAASGSSVAADNTGQVKVTQNIDAKGLLKHLNVDADLGVVDVAIGVEYNSKGELVGEVSAAREFTFIDEKIASAQLKGAVNTEGDISVAAEGKLIGKSIQTSAALKTGAVANNTATLFDIVEQSLQEWVDFKVEQSVNKIRYGH